MTTKTITNLADVRQGDRAYFIHVDHPTTGLEGDVVSYAAGETGANPYLAGYGEVSPTYWEFASAAREVPEWKNPGTPGTAKVRGVEGVRVMRILDGPPGAWGWAVADGQLYLDPDVAVTDFVPDDAEALRAELALVTQQRDLGGEECRKLRAELADWMRASARDGAHSAILQLVHTVATRGGEGEVAGVKVERLDEDGTTPAMRHLAQARSDFAAQEGIAEELREQLGAKIKLTQEQARVIERVRAMHGPAPRSLPGDSSWCQACERFMPCPTMAAIDGEPATPRIATGGPVEPGVLPVWTACLVPSRPQDADEASARSLGDRLRAFGNAHTTSWPLHGAMRELAAEADRLERERDRAVAERDEVLAALDGGLDPRMKALADAAASMPIALRELTAAVVDMASADGELERAMREADLAWPFKPGDIVHSSGPTSDAEWLEDALVGTVVMDDEGKKWTIGPRKRDGRQVRSRWRAGLGWAMSSARLAERGRLTVISVPWIGPQNAQNQTEAGK
jgi:hypothetical protein